MTRQEPFSDDQEAIDALARHTHATALTSLLHATIHMVDAVEACPGVENLLRGTLQEALNQSRKFVLVLEAEL